MRTTIKVLPTRVGKIMRLTNDEWNVSVSLTDEQCEQLAAKLTGSGGALKVGVV